MSWGSDDGYYNGQNTPMPGWEETPQYTVGRPPRRRGRVWAVIAAVVAGVLVLGVAAVFVLARTGLLSGGPDTPPVSDGSDTVRDPGEVGVRYSVLGSDLMTGASGCQTAAKEQGESDHITCTFPVGNLDLVTYTDISAFDAHRNATVTALEAAPYYNRTGVSKDAMYAEYSDNSRATLTWNVRSARQSATISGVRNQLDSLRSWYDERGVAVLTRPVVLADLSADPAVLALIEPYYNESDSVCQVEDPDDTEEEQVHCRIGDYDAVVHRKKSQAEVEASRQALRDQGATNESTWSLDGTVQGTSMTFLDSMGNPAVYYDVPDSLVNVYVFGTVDKQTVDNTVSYWKQQTGATTP